MITDLQPKFETVMIIDDNIIDLYVCSRMITKNNFGKKVLEYSVAADAMKFLQDNQDNFSELPQIIFLDIYMPQMSGFEFMEEYEKLSPALKDRCKAYIISSTIDNEDIIKSHTDPNVVSFQVKPITKDFLDRIIAE
ncbi:MAG TPA: response regulator [Flavobacterium sp.]|nr:response regulator [Flavobacterium sp.]